jgi:hypothetical protein
VGLDVYWTGDHPIGVQPGTVCYALRQQLRNADRRGMGDHVLQNAGHLGQSRCLTPSLRRECSESNWAGAAWYCKQFVIHYMYVGAILTLATETG